MGFPKKISQFPINPDLTGQDLLVTVNEFDVTNRINLQQLRDFVIDGKDNTFVTGGTVTEDAELILFRNDGLSLTVDLNPAFSNTLTGADNIPGGEGLIFSGKTNNELLFRSISGGENVTIETLDNTIQISVEIPPDTNTFVTGATLTDVNNLIIGRNDGINIDVSLESLAEDIYVESASLDGTTYTLSRNDGVELSTNLSTVVSGSVTTALFDSYTATTKTDIDSKLNKIEFNTYSATTKGILDNYTASTQTEINSKLDVSTFDSYTANTLDIYVSGGTLSGTDLILERTDDNTVNIDLSALSGVTQNSFVTGFTYDNKNNLTISRNDGLSNISTNLSEMSGLTINGDLTVTGDTQIDGRLTVEDQTWFKGSPITFGNSFADSIDFTGRINGNFVPVNDNTSDMGKPTTLSAQKYWRNFYVYNITGGTLNLFNTPTLNNSGTEILVRNTSTGQIDYRDVTTLSGSPTDTFVTGLTYNSTSNTVTLTQNESGPTQSVVIDSFSGVTLNGTTNINGNTVVDGDVLITKNVVILGTATTINSSTFSVDDNIITLNANATGSTVPLPIDSGIDILRNSGDTAVLLWEELNGYWAAGLSGATEPLIVNGNNLGGGTNVFKQRNENVLDFNTLSGGTNVTLTAVGDIVRFDVPDNTNTFITGATLNGNTLEIERNDGVDVPVDLTSLISGKLDISTFDSYTANTLDIYVTGGTLSSNTLELGRTDGDTVSIDLSSINFTGNTSGDCITNLWVSNINGCNQVTIGTELVVDDFISGKTTTLFGENTTGGASRLGLNPTLTIFDDGGSGGGAQTYSGPTLRLSDNGNTADIFYRYNGGGNVISNALNFISDGGFNFIAEGDNGSPALSDGPYFRVTKGQSSLSIYDDTTRPRTDVKITNVNGGSAYSRLGVGAQSDYWYIEADDVDTPMHIGYDDNGVDTNVFTFEKSEGLLEGSLEITSGLTANTITVSDIYSTGDTQTPITFHGSLSQSNCTASGDNSVAFGFDTTANGADTFAIGYDTQSSGSESFAGGVGTEVSGAISFGFGLNHIVSGNKSFVIGGEGITGSTDETVYVPNLNIDSTPTVNNSGTEILVRNTTTGNVEYRESNTLGSITGATNVTTTGLFKQINGKDLEFKGIQSSGGTVTITTDANTVNLESTSSGGNTVNSATKVFNWFMTIT